MRIGLLRHGIGKVRHAAGMQRRGPARKACHGEIEAAPEKMYRAALADKGGPEGFEYAVGLKQNPPMALGEIGLVGGMQAVLVEGDGVCYLIGPFVDADGDAELPQGLHQFGIELGDGARRKREFLARSVVGIDAQHVPQKVEFELETSLSIRDRRRG